MILTVRWHSTAWDGTFLKYITKQVHFNNHKGIDIFVNFYI